MSLQSWTPVSPNNFSGNGQTGAYQAIPTEEVFYNAIDSPSVSSSEYVVNWLIAANHDDVFGVLKILVMRRPSLVNELLAETSAVGLGGGKYAVTRGLRPRALDQWSAGDEIPTVTSYGLNSGVADTEASKKPDGPVVQFRSAKYYCREGDQEILLTVLRIGSLKAPSEVAFETRDGTAIAGNNFIGSRGILSFAPGEIQKNIHVPLLANDRWDTTLEFQAVLLTDGTVGAVVANPMGRTRIKIIDDDCFPTNKYAEAIRAKNWKQIPTIGLFWEYFKMNFQNAEVRSRAVKLLIKGQVPNLFFAIRAFASMYLLDFVLNDESPADRLFYFKDRGHVLSIVAVALVLGFGVLHLLEYTSRMFGAGGGARRNLQSALLFKFLNYTNASRHDVGQTDLILSITRDTHTLVDKGFINIIDLIEALGTYTVTILYQLVTPLILGKQIRWPIFLVSLSFLPVLCAILILRNARTAQYFRIEHAMRASLASHVEQAVANYDLIADYSKRVMVTERFENRVREYNAANRESAQVRENNRQVPGWLTTLVLAIYVWYCGHKVIEDELSVGIFTTDISLFMKIGASASAIYEIFLEMMASEPELERIVKQVNLPVEDPERFYLDLHRHELSDGDMRTLKGTNDVSVIDTMPISLQNVLFSYHSVPGAVDLSAMDSFTFECQQGELVCIVGRRGENKATLLKLIGGMNIATLDVGRSTFRVPTHLRALHVSAEPMFFGGTLYENLTFGLLATDEDGNIERVCRICERLTLPVKVMHYLTSGNVLDWHSILSQTEKHLLRVARCLISNCELLCIHKPAELFNNKTSGIVFDILKEYVRLKGIESAARSIGNVRPRTCIFTAEKLAGVEAADRIFHVSKKDGVREIGKNEATDEMLM